MYTCTLILCLGMSDWFTWSYFALFNCLSIFCSVCRITYMGYSVVCMVGSGGFLVLLFDSFFFSLSLFSFLLAWLDVWVNYCSFPGAVYVTSELFTVHYFFCSTTKFIVHCTFWVNYSVLVFRV